MTTEQEQVELTPEERVLRQKQVRKIVLLRGFLLGAVIAAWWIFFAPDEVVGGEYKLILGVLVGVLAAGSYLFNLRETLFPKK
jgi:hypothetical protein